MHILTAEPLPFDPNQVTPGVIGFAVTALVAGVIILLLIDFFRRVSRINDRADVKARIDAELAEQRARHCMILRNRSPSLHASFQ